MDIELIYAGRTLGMSERAIFCRIMVPMSLPGIVAGAVLAFARALGEYGATTGRPRRCGWFDAPVVEVANRVNGCTDVFLSKLDVLSGWERIPICVAYEINGRRSDVFPMTQAELQIAKPILEFLPGWSENITKIRDFAGLPANCQAYVKRLEELIRCRISGIGVGPGREEAVMINDLV